jgi:ATP adenylyltransferase
VSLEILWAGWRASYVATAADVPAGEGSVFTRILASGLPDTEIHVVWRGRACFAICNAFPYTSGHLLVMPYREVPDLEELTSEEHSELWTAVRDAVVAVKAAYRPEGVNIGMNLGRPAGAGVPGHLHVHVLPRWNGDTSFMSVVAGTRVIPEDLASSAAKLRAAWPPASAAP